MDAHTPVSVNQISVNLKIFLLLKQRNVRLFWNTLHKSLNLDTSTVKMKLYLHLEPRYVVDSEKNPKLILFNIVYFFQMGSSLPVWSFFISKFYNK